MSAKAKTPKIPQNPLKREPWIVSLSRLSRMSEKLSIFFLDTHRQANSTHNIRRMEWKLSDERRAHVKNEQKSATH